MRFGFVIRRHQGPLGLTDDRAGRRTFCQSNDLAPLYFGQARSAPRSRPITQPVDPLGIETHDAFAHGLGMAAQFVRNRGGSPPLPTSDNHLSPQNPIAGCVPTLGKPTNLAFFRIIARGLGTEQLRHRRLPIILDDASILHHH
jgi:hypothetical protein